MTYRATWKDGALTVFNPPKLEDGERVLVEIERLRSAPSHRHQFAWVKDVWATLPEDVQGKPWAETPETFRKHALIATGYHKTYIVDCGQDNAAEAVRHALRRAERKAHGYALARVSGPVVQVWTPESQSYAAMGHERFQESKTAIMDWMAAQIGTTTAEMMNGVSAPM